MKVLFIGGTGNISTSVSRLAVKQGIELHLLNRGKNNIEIIGTHSITANIYNLNEAREALEDHTWDVVVNWIAFTPEHVKNDLELFRGKTKQYIFISSASVYQKPPTSHIITESTPLINPYWKYSRDKIECEEILQKAYREEQFPMTIVRPSHTYDRIIPLAIGGGSEYTALDRMKKGKKVIIHGDGTSLWTLTHSRDFAKGFSGLLGNRQAVGHDFHITSDEVLNWNQIYETIADALGVELNAVHITSEFIGKVVPEEKDGLFGDKAYCAIFDNTKIKSLVPEYKATIPFRNGIKETLAWFEADTDRMVVNEEINKRMDKIISAYEN